MRTLLVIGTGLIGSSFARAARLANTFQRILGMDSSSQHLKTALDLGIIDESVSDLAEGLARLNELSNDRWEGDSKQQAAAVMVATPVADIARHVIEIFSSETEPKPLVFDCGSVKGRIVRQIEEAMGRLPGNFVPAHPIAGRERHGPAAAQGRLFQEHRVILTPTSSTDPNALEQVSQWWQSCGARTEILDVSEHDRLLGLTSHLPHLLSFTFMDWIVQAGGEQAFDYAAGGFRDFTRVAESDPRLWREIFESNDRFLLQHLDSWLKNAERVQELIKHRQWEELESLLLRAQQGRLKYRDALVESRIHPEDPGYPESSPDD